MTTIFTDEFIFTEAETSIYIDEPEMSYTGRDLVFASGNCEVRLRLTDGQYKELGEELGINGYITIMEEGES